MTGLIMLVAQDHPDTRVLAGQLMCVFFLCMSLYFDAYERRADFVLATVYLVQLVLTLSVGVIIYSGIATDTLCSVYNSFLRLRIVGYIGRCGNYPSCN
jgi:hypothetical protein